MATRWLIRITFLTGLMSVAAVAADRAAPAGGGGGGGTRGLGGSGAAPANPPAKAAPTPPQRNQPQQQPQSGNNGARRDDGPAGGTAQQQGGAQPSRSAPPSANDAAKGNQLRGQLNRDRQLGDRRAEQYDHRRRPYDPQYGGGSPSWWWHGGQNYWGPGNGDGYRDNVPPTAGASESVNNVTPPQPEAPSATLEQARNQNELEGTPLYVQVSVEMKKTQAVYDTASQKVLERLKDNPEYQRLVQQRDEAGVQVEAVQAAARIPSPERVTSAAQQKLDVSARITRMEQDAINADPTAKAAKDRLVELNEKLTALRKQANTAR